MAPRLVSSTVMRVHEVPKMGIVLGSSPKCGLRDTDVSVQARHCRVALEDGRLTLEDLNSSTGTFLNGKRIDGIVTISYGDRIRCGESPVAVVVEASDARPPDEDAGSRASVESAEILSLTHRLARTEDALAAARADHAMVRADLEELRRAAATVRETAEQQIAAAHAEAARFHALAVASETERARVAELLQASTNLTEELRNVIDSLQRSSRPDV